MFSIKDFFSNCDQIRRFLPVWSHLVNKSIMENFIFCAVCNIYIPNNYKRVDFQTDDYKNKANSLKLSELAMSEQSERIPIASLQSRIPIEFRARISRENENKSRLIELLLTYIKE